MEEKMGKERNIIKIKPEYMKVNNKKKKKTDKEKNLMIMEN